MRRLRIVIPLAVLASALLVGGAAAFGVIDEPLPTGYVGVPYSYQVKVSGGNPPYEFTIKSGSLPPGLGMSLSGLIAGTPSSSGSWKFYIEGSYRFGSNPPLYSQRQFTLNVGVGLAIQQSSLPTLVVGTPYSTQLTASGGGTQTWTVVGGTPPAGLTLATNGALSGTPTTAGRYEFAVRVSDGSRTATQAYTVDVIEALVATAPEVPVAVVGSDFNLTLSASGGRAPYTWAIQDASTWPRGLAFVNGVISGKPRVAGSYAPTVTVTDALGNVVAVPLAIVVNPRLKIPLQLLKPGTVGKLYRARIVVKGGATPLTFEISDGDLPRGVRLNARTGALTGKPRLKGRYGFEVVVADQLGNTHQRRFVLRVR